MNVTKEHSVVCVCVSIYITILATLVVLAVVNTPSLHKGVSGIDPRLDDLDPSWLYPRSNGSPTDRAELATTRFGATQTQHTVTAWLQHDCGRVDLTHNTHRLGRVEIIPPLLHVEASGNLHTGL